MKKYISCMAGVFLFGFVAVLQASEVPAEVSSELPSIFIIADTTGSMQEEIELTNEEGEKEDISKILSFKNMLLKMIEAHSFSDFQLSILGIRYIGSSDAYYDTFLPLEKYKPEDLTDGISEEFETDFQIFNRRSATANALRQLDESVLEELTGAITLLIVSDGNENMHDLDEDRDESKKEERKDDSLIGPLTEIQRLKEKYGDRLTIHTLFWEQTDDEDPAGKKFLVEASSLGKHFTLWDFNTDPAGTEKLYQALVQVKGAE